MSEIEMAEQTINIPAWLFSDSKMNRIQVPIERPLEPFVMDGIYFPPHLTAEYIATEHIREDGMRMYYLVSV